MKWIFTNFFNMVPVVRSPRCHVCNHTYLQHQGDVVGFQNIEIISQILYKTEYYNKLSCMESLQSHQTISKSCVYLLFLSLKKLSRI
jgi:hypothetical protein